MPIYLVHGFRWPRPLIRIHIILQNLDDAAAEWLMAPGTTTAMIENFHRLLPTAMKHLPSLRFVEQHDPTDLLAANAPSQPYAYVADVCEEIKSSIDIDEVRSRGTRNEQWAALMELRDRLAPEEKVGWYVVICADEKRNAPSPPNSPPQDHVVGTQRVTSHAHSSSYPSQHVHEEKHSSPGRSPPRGLKKLFAVGMRRGRAKSRANEAPSRSRSSPSAPDPPPPQLPSMTPGQTAPASALVSPGLSASNPTNESRHSGSRSISPLGEANSTPDTELSLPPMRRHSYAPSSIVSRSRGVSPISVRKPLGSHPQTRESSPTPRSRAVQVRQPHRAEDTITPLQQVHVQNKKLHTYTNNRHSASSQSSRTSLNPARSSAPAVKTTGYEEVITMIPSSSTPIHTYRRSQPSLSSGRLDSTSVSENINPAVYMPTHGSNTLETTKYRFEHVPAASKPRYFGSAINNFDLVANNIENAFQAMR